LSRTARIWILIAIVLVLVVMRGLSPAPPAAKNAFGHGPTIVLVHGLGSSTEDWLPVARKLAHDHRVVLVDLPGHGLSAAPDPFSLEQVSLALDAAIANETQDGPVILVGHSLGGLACAQYALDHPRRVRGLVLIESALTPQIEPGERAKLEQTLDHDYASFVRAAYMSYGRDSLQGERLWDQVRQQDPEMVKRWIRLAWTADLSERAAAITVPVLAVLSERAWPQGEPWTQATLELGYRKLYAVHPVRFSGCGHFIMLDRPDDLARVIANFAANPEGDWVAGK
jgi:pimeloyl-ACP methyl ester carboxylesterase